MTENRTFDKRFSELKNVKKELQQEQIVCSAISGICALIRKYLDEENVY